MAINKWVVNNLLLVCCRPVEGQPTRQWGVLEVDLLLGVQSKIPLQGFVTPSLIRSETD